MTEEKGYNGWSNYETWAINVWLTNDESSYDYLMEQVDEAYKSASATEYATREQTATYNLSQTLQLEAEENKPEVSGYYADLLNSALGSVDWYELAKHYIDDLDKSEYDNEEDGEQ